MAKRFWTFLRIAGVSAERFFEEGYAYSASALAFTTLLALVPLVSVVVSLAAYFPIFLRLITIAQNFVLNNFIPTANETIQFYLQNFTQQASRLHPSGIFFLFFTATMLIVTVEDTIDDIWQVKQREKKFLAWVLYWIVLLIAPLAIGFSVFLSTLIFSISWFANGTLEHLFKTPLLAVLSLSINTILFSLLYVIVPNIPVRWQDGLFGGFLAAILFEIAKKCFSFYIHTFNSYQLIYGALATIPIFLVWVYISWLIVLYGALFTHTCDTFWKKNYPSS